MYRVAFSSQYHGGWYHFRHFAIIGDLFTLNGVVKHICLDYELTAVYDFNKKNCAKKY